MNTCFIVPACTAPAAKPLSYSRIRSVFSYEERVEQVLCTLASIKDRAPFSKIILIEGGLEDIREALPPEITYHYLGANRIVRWAVDSPFKGLGESVMLLFALVKCIPRKDVELFFKISARYTLTKAFLLSSWEMEKISFLFYGDGVSTRCYAVPRKFVRAWFFALLRSIPRLLQGKSIEDVLPQYIHKKNISSRTFLGVSGLIGPDGARVEE